MRRPSLFIGSSVEALDVAYAIQENLEFDCEPTVWSQGVFKPTSAALTDLFAFSGRAEFAVFVFTPDDIVHMRGNSVPAARDNVIFELGLFVGALGPSRCFYVVPHGEELHLPSDLIGVEPLRYVADRSDRNLRAALGPASNRIRQATRSIAPPQGSLGPDVHQERLATPHQLAEQLISAWNAAPLLQVREILRAGVPGHMSEDVEGKSTQALSDAYQFLNSVADGVLTGSVDEELAWRTFSEAMTAVWAAAYSYFVPAGADPQEAWQPLPALAQLVGRWHQAAR